MANSNQNKNMTSSPEIFADRSGVPALIANHIIEQIRDGVWKPGDKLPTERQLAAEMGVSRPSLREALRALEILGLLRMRQGSGVFVSAFGSEDMLIPLHLFISLEPGSIDALFEARIALESQVVALAATKITDEQLVQLRETVIAPPESEDEIVIFIEADLAFHRLITKVADNVFLARMIKSIEYLGQASRQITGFVPGVMQQSAKDHRLILDALAARDSGKAHAAMTQHLLNVREAYRQQLEPGA